MQTAKYQDDKIQHDLLGHFRDRIVLPKLCRNNHFLVSETDLWGQKYRNGGGQALLTYIVGNYWGISYTNFLLSGRNGKIRGDVVTWITQSIIP